MAAVGKRMTAKEERDAFVDDFIANPEKYRAEWTAKARRDQPHLTDEQLDASWAQLVDQFGL